MPLIPHKVSFLQPRNRSVKYIVCATALMAILSSGCKDQKLIDDYQKLTIENERLKNDLSENAKQRLRQEGTLESLGAEIRKINKNSEIEAERYKNEILSLKKELDLKTKKIDDFTKEIAAQKQQENSQLSIVNDAMLYLQNEDFSVYEKEGANTVSNGLRKDSSKYKQHTYWDFKIESSNSAVLNTPALGYNLGGKKFSWRGFYENFSNTHHYYNDKNIGYQIVNADYNSFNLSEFNGAVIVKSVEVCGKQKTELTIKVKRAINAEFNYSPGVWDVVGTYPSKTFFYKHLDWVKVAPPKESVSDYSFVIEVEKAPRFKAALEAIIKSSGGKISSF